MSDNSISKISLNDDCTYMGTMTIGVSGPAVCVYNAGVPCIYQSAQPLRGGLMGTPPVYGCDGSSKKSGK